MIWTLEVREGRLEDVFKNHKKSCCRTFKNYLNLKAKAIKGPKKNSVKNDQNNYLRIHVETVYELALKISKPLNVLEDGPQMVPKKKILESEGL